MAMTSPPSPVRRTRQKRMSHEQEEIEENWLPSASDGKQFFASHTTALLATYSLAYLYFHHIVAPLTPTDTDQVVVQPTKSVPLRGHGIGLTLATGSLGMQLFDATQSIPKVTAAPTSELSDSFVLTCALVHTLIVCVGFAVGRDTLLVVNWSRPMLRLASVVFSLLCAVLWAAAEFQIGPVPPIGQILFSSRAYFVLGGALSMTAWLGCAMLMPHNAAGRTCTASTRLHKLIIATGVALHYFDVSATGSLATFGLLGLLVALLSAHADATNRKRIEAAAWNL